LSFKGLAGLGWAGRGKAWHGKAGRGMAGHGMEIYPNESYSEVIMDKTTKAGPSYAQQRKALLCMVFIISATVFAVLCAIHAHPITWFMGAYVCGWVCSRLVVVHSIGSLFKIIPVGKDKHFK